MFFSITRGYDVRCPSLASASAFFYNPVSLFFHLRKLCCGFASHARNRKTFSYKYSHVSKFLHMFPVRGNFTHCFQDQVSTSNILGFVRAHISRKKLFTHADKHDKTLKQETNISDGFRDHASKGIQGLSFITYF